MKKVLFLLSFFVLSFTVFAQTANEGENQANALNLQDYVGNYRIKNAPIEFVSLTLQEGKLIGEIQGQGNVELKPTPEPNVFEVPAFGAVVIFLRDETNKVATCKLSIQGAILEGEFMK